ncbi:hypothetical protein FOXG_21397 [Fusarium oxysporum f. sp. lycopersici 4287]|uniref:Uncharacterized protein n=1 Tax=Fusarium oxysporum f. sp. lycopersici (strain 4287 / CBS 123668 / FGSC 9935 / NRRL 34936) TaxID=426428 RepID=A0A0J9WS63_FUSO4|nr:hypothetical protein FOXG_20902 [Fusarium oxysporum f. sp. lycopersici 4287]XP_018253649.1 hypothetical protein FOXG_21397 [Fusarium oxysporum f. sp. lycopersici 4287]EWZ77924.1 hypothetical protein FOWG_17710 [Fusarium oxysporum f. sp. lycopersici MN25]KAJ9412976.1 hypothetical protein QL093DRAFT_2525269 [Fusarium oxysporum]KNB13732.1 hypothetical protein FOXG_20902 [Fusarium oxysporum f. sp. lycopersici 4287]KNB15604.1 hypothetical protein FOXG_21397 [Fusarium oxysporum f. sp. lycopersici
MSTNSAEKLIQQHPTNVVANPGYKTASDKSWSNSYKPIKSTTSYIKIQNGVIDANFENAFMGMMEDDAMRFRQPAVPTNQRYWRLETEADCENWFNTEITNVVLSAWHSNPPLMQTSHTKPLTEENIPENVDCTFSVKHGGKRYTVAIGEFKRNLLDPNEWGSGSINKGGQRKLSQELRGYASKYKCPQVFCFDGSNLVLLQFRAHRVEGIKNEDCEIDSWMIPVKNSSCSLRYALYRLLAQGWRRCQGEVAAVTGFTVGGLAPCSREYYTGVPIWKAANGQRQKSHPLGYQRTVDGSTGAVVW